MVFCALSNNLSLANLSNFSGVSAGTSTILNQSVLLGTINLELDTDERSVTLSGSWLDFLLSIFASLTTTSFSDSESEVSSDSLSFSLMLSSSSSTTSSSDTFSSSSSSPSTSSGTSSSSSSLTTIASSSPKPIPFMNLLKSALKFLSNFESSSNSCSLLSSSLSIPSTSFKSSSVAPNANASRRNISSTPLVFLAFAFAGVAGFFLSFCISLSFELAFFDFCCDLVWLSFCKFNLLNILSFNEDKFKPELMTDTVKTE